MAKAPVRIIDVTAGALIGEFTSPKEAEEALKTGFHGMKSGRRYIIASIHKEYTASLQVLLEDSTASLLKKEAHDASAEVEQAGLEPGDVEQPVKEIPEKEQERTQVSEATEEAPVAEPKVEEPVKEVEPVSEKEVVDVPWEEDPKEAKPVTSEEPESEPAESVEDALDSASQIDEAMEDLNSQSSEEEDELDKLEKELTF
jgi:hypothetical protein